MTTFKGKGKKELNFIQAWPSLKEKYRSGFT
jgi:hypothetical protein